MSEVRQEAAGFGPMRAEGNPRPDTIGHEPSSRTLSGSYGPPILPAADRQSDRATWKEASIRRRRSFEAR